MALSFHLSTPRDSGVQRRLGDTLAQHLAGADLLGRLQIVAHTRKKTGRVIPIAAGASSHTGHVRFEEEDDPTSAPQFGVDFRIPDNTSPAYLRNLTPVTRQVFDGLTAQYQRDAFTLAGASDVRLIAKVQDALAEIAAKGGTAGDFERAVKQLTEQAGVEQMSAFTLDTAFNTAMQKAYSAGRLQQMQAPTTQSLLPYWQYWTVGDDRVRPEHAVLDGFVARAIDPVWRKIYPPSGFNCRCSVVPITAEEAHALSDKADDGGLERLPMLARIKVPQQGFHSLIA